MLVRHGGGGHLITNVRRKDMPADSVQLLAELDRCVRQNVLPFFADVGATYQSGLSGYDGYPGPCTLKSTGFTVVGCTFFWWVHRFSSDYSVFDIGYGDRESVVETKIYYLGPKMWFAPWELLVAHGASDPQAMSGNAWVLTMDFMERTISSIATGTRKYWSLLARPNEALLKRTERLRADRLASAQQEERRKERERASVQASRAFHEGRIEEAIKLLGPFQNDEELSRSSRMLLDVARRRDK